MKQNTAKLVSTILLTTGMLACSSATVESDNVTNEAIWAGIRITSADGQGSSINVELNVGGSTGTNLVLSNGDRVIATSGSQEVVLTEDSDFLDVDYEGEISTGSSGAQISISLERANAENITGSSVNLPAALSIDFPQPNMVFDSLQNIEILWTAGESADNVTLLQTAVCKDSANQDVVISENLSVADNGRYNSDFLSQRLTGVINASGCDFTVAIDRITTGTLAAGFGAGGFIRATQTREVTGMRIQVI